VVHRGRRRAPAPTRREAGRPTAGAGGRPSPCTQRRRGDASPHTPGRPRRVGRAVTAAPAPRGRRKTAKRRAPSAGRSAAQRRRHRQRRGPPRGRPSRRRGGAGGRLRTGCAPGGAPRGGARVSQPHRGTHAPRRRRRATGGRRRRRRGGGAGAPTAAAAPVPRRPRRRRCPDGRGRAGTPKIPRGRSTAQSAPASDRGRRVCPGGPTRAAHGGDPLRRRRRRSSGRVVPAAPSARRGLRTGRRSPGAPRSRGPSGSRLPRGRRGQLGRLPWASGRVGGGARGPPKPPRRWIDGWPTRRRRGAGGRATGVAGAGDCVCSRRLCVGGRLTAARGGDPAGGLPAKS